LLVCVNVECVAIGLCVRVCVRERKGLVKQ